MSLEITFPRTACSTSLTVGSQGVSRHSRRLGTQSARCDGAHSLPTLPPPLCLALSCGAVNPDRTGRTELASVTYLYRDRFASGCNIPTSPTFCKTLRSGGRKWKRYSVLAQRQKNTSVFAMRFSLRTLAAWRACTASPLPSPSLCKRNLSTASRVSSDKTLCALAEFFLTMLYPTTQGPSSKPELARKVRGLETSHHSRASASFHSAKREN